MEQLKRNLTSRYQWGGNDPPPLTRVEVPLAVETNFCEDDLIIKRCLESNVIWSVAPESIIHALLETGVKICKTLPPLSADAAKVEASSVVDLLPETSESSLFMVKGVAQRKRREARTDPWRVQPWVSLIFHPNSPIVMNRCVASSIHHLNSSSTIKHA